MICKTRAVIFDTAAVLATVVLSLTAFCSTVAFASTPSSTTGGTNTTDGTNTASGTMGTATTDTTGGTVTNGGAGTMGGAVNRGTGNRARGAVRTVGAHTVGASSGAARGGGAHTVGASGGSSASGASSASGGAHTAVASSESGVSSLAGPMLTAPGVLPYRVDSDSNSSTASPAQTATESRPSPQQTYRSQSSDNAAAFGAKAAAARSESKASGNQYKASTTPAAPTWSSNFDAVKKLQRANSKDVYGWKIIEHICLESDINSKTAKPGDKVWGLLDDDCKFGSKLIAARDSLIKGHLVEVDGTRTLLGASLSSAKRYHSGASLGIQFDEIVDQDGQSWPIVGKLCRIHDISPGGPGASPRLVQVDKDGDVIKGGPTLTDNERSAVLATRVATAVPLPVSLAMNIVGVPAVMGVIGAASPTIVYGKPIDVKEKNARAKGFVYGFVTNLPGAFFVASCIQKGDDIELKAGDGLVVDLTFRDNEYCTRGRLAVTGSVIK